MKSRIAGLLAAAVLAALLAGGAQADSQRLIKIGIGGGFSMPVGDAKDLFKNGVHAQGYVRLQPPKMPLAFRGSLGYQHFNMQDAAAGAGNTGTGSMLSGLAGATLGMQAGPIRPYVTLSLGAYHLSTDVTTTTAAMATVAGVSTASIRTTTTSAPSTTKFGVNAGVGALIKLGGIHGFAEAKFDNVFTESGFDNPLKDTSGTRFIPVTFGVEF